MAIVSRTSTSWQNGSYEGDRNQLLKEVENARLLADGIALGVSLVPNPNGGDNITVGYVFPVSDHETDRRNCLRRISGTS